ncbi:hypothetical protein N9W79_01460 [bacterium]|nr:hypothetical protein [bacterium]
MHFLKIKFSVLYIALFFSVSCESIGIQSSESKWKDTFKCAKGLLESGITGPNIEKMSNHCILVEQGRFLYFYTTKGVSKKNSNVVFDGEELKVCNQQYLSGANITDFSSIQRKYELSLLKQFPNSQVKPFKFAHALVAYKNPFNRTLELCRKSGEDKKLDSFTRNIRLIEQHVQFLSKSREKDYTDIRGKVVLKRLRRESKTKWVATLRVSIVNKGKTNYRYASTCNSSSAYYSPTKNTFIYEEPCGDVSYDLYNIPPEGVYRDDIEVTVLSKARPTGKEIDLHFSAAPSLFLGTIKIPEKR